ncbi:putative leucine-rich repeat-containing protein DDB_G0290503 [Aphidius gifuensis]|nr:putative leucine-rich repeat-containing protein DDB_G0290503 [Aphidius gifuensis]
MTLTDERFLSITLDSNVIFNGALFKNNSERNINMAKALSPAFVRIAGPKSNSYIFQKNNITNDDSSFVLTSGNWSMLNQWAENAGLSVLAAVAPQQHSEDIGGFRDKIWDSRNVLDLISFSDEKGYNVSWQLGYECQTRCDMSGKELGKNLMRLKNMLEAFPRYSKATITGPDIVTMKTAHDQIYLQEYMSTGSDALSAITWHPDFASITLDSKSGVLIHHDSLAYDKETLHRIIGRNNAKKPLWLVESKPEECKDQFLGALIWTRRLGNSAKLGVQVLMRQPLNSNLFKPTPDFWVSVLHKTLVGREVLDAKIITENPSHINVYCQCTKPSSRYEKGSITIFGINLASTRLVINLKGIKIKTLHKYILLPGFDANNQMFSETVLLNNETLKLENEKDMPELKPAVVTSEKGISMKLPSGGIGFWVIPDIKIKSCEDRENEYADKMILEKFSKHLSIAESDENTSSKESTDENIEGSRKSIYNIMKKINAKRDMERLEKLLRRREIYDDKKNKYAHIGFYEKLPVNTNETESEEDMKTKLEEYKKRVSELELRMKYPMQYNDRQNTDGDIIDSDKIPDAINLIKKIESGLKNLNDKSYSLYDSIDNEKSTQAGTNNDDNFLNELLKSRKTKRASISEVVEQNLRAIYNMLADEQLKRQKFKKEQGTMLARKKRDTDKKLSRPSTSKKTNKIEERKLLLERIQKHNSDKKKPAKLTLKNHKSESQENNFYGFERLPRLENFPTGDVHVEVGKIKVDEVEDDDDDDVIPVGGRMKKSSNFESFIETKEENLNQSSDDFSDIVSSKAPSYNTNKHMKMNANNNKNKNVRQKRSIQDINTILNNEMIFEDDNNQRDCQCRSTRNVVTHLCKNCKINAKKNERSLAKSRGQRMNKKFVIISRERRDTTANEEQNDNHDKLIEKINDKNPTNDDKISQDMSSNSKHLNKAEELQKGLSKSSEILPKLHEDAANEAPKVKHARHVTERPRQRADKNREKTQKSTAETSTNQVKKRKLRLLTPPAASTSTTTTTISTTMSTALKSAKAAKQSTPSSTSTTVKTIENTSTEKHEKNHKSMNKLKHKKKKNQQDTKEPVNDEGKNDTHSSIRMKHKNKKNQKDPAVAQAQDEKLRKILFEDHKQKRHKHFKQLRNKLNHDEPSTTSPTDTKKKTEKNKAKIVKRSVMLPIQDEDILQAVNDSNDNVNNFHLVHTAPRCDKCSSKKKELKNNASSEKNIKNINENKSTTVKNLENISDDKMKPKYKRLMMKHQEKIKNAEKKNHKYIYRGKRNANYKIPNDYVENEIWKNGIEIKNNEKKKSINDLSNLNGYIPDEIFKNHTKIVNKEISSFVKETIPIIGNVLTNQLGKIQNITGKIEKLIENYKEADNAVDAINENYEEVIKNNPDGLLTFNFFNDTIKRIKIFFSFFTAAVAAFGQ